MFSALPSFDIFGMCAIGFPIIPPRLLLLLPGVRRSFLFLTLICKLTKDRRYVALTLQPPRGKEVLVLR